MTIPGPDMGVTPEMRRQDPDDPATCLWCGGDVVSTSESIEHAWTGECFGCDATVIETQPDEHEWTPTQRTIVNLAQQLIRPNTWRHISEEIRREICDALADDVRIAEKAALEAAREAIDANRARTGAA